VYEYCIWDNINNVLHRGPMTKMEAIEWMDDARDIIPDTAKINKLWSVRRRPVGEWEEFRG